MEKKKSPINISPHSFKTDKSSNSDSKTPKSPAIKSPEKNSIKASESPIPPLPKKKAKGYCITPPSSSGTQYFRRESRGDAFERVNSDQYVGLSESMSGSSLTFNCIHGPEGKQYTEKGLLKRNILKGLDPIPVCK